MGLLYIYLYLYLFTIKWARNKMILAYFIVKYDNFNVLKIL